MWVALRAASREKESLSFSLGVEMAAISIRSEGVVARNEQRRVGVQRRRRCDHRKANAVRLKGCLSVFGSDHEVKPVGFDNDCAMLICTIHACASSRQVRQGLPVGMAVAVAPTGRIDG